MSKKTVLFVCRGNRFRSRIAEELFNRVAPDNFRAESAGMIIKDHNCRATKTVLREIGIKMSERKPRKLSKGMMEKAYRIVVFDGVNFPSKNVETWPVKDCRTGDENCIRKGRVQIGKLVEKNVKSL